MISMKSVRYNGEIQSEKQSIKEEGEVKRAQREGTQFHQQTFLTHLSRTSQVKGTT